MREWKLERASVQITDLISSCDRLRSRIQCGGVKAKGCRVPRDIHGANEIRDWNCRVRGLMRRLFWTVEG
jgi:hypothetical protein